MQVGEPCGLWPRPRGRTGKGPSRPKDSTCKGWEGGGARSQALQAAPRVAEAWVRRNEVGEGLESGQGRCLGGRGAGEDPSSRKAN